MRWAGITGALLLVGGALLVRHWTLARRPVWLGAASPTLPDAPDAREQIFLSRLASGRADDPTSARRLGEYYLNSARPFAALWALSQPLARQPADLQATEGLARALGEALFYDAAIRRWRDVLAREPAQPQAVLQLSELYLQTGQPGAVLPVVRAAGAAFASSKVGSVLLGRARQALGDASGAKAAYWRALAQDTSDPDIRHRIGLLALSQDEISAAQQAFGAARVMAPENPRYEVDLGRAFAASSLPEERRRAPEFYAAAVNQSPRFAPASVEWGRWYLRESRWKEAIDRLQIAVDVEPGDADAHETLARALEADGRRAEAHRQQGLADDARGLPTAALREYEAWAALDQNNPEAEIQVAQCEHDLDRTQEAQARLEQARRRFPRSVPLRERLIAFYILGLDQAQARRLCQEWLREEPGSAQALWLLGRAAEASRQYAETLRLDEQALAREPDNLPWLGAYGGTLLAMPGTDARSESARQAVAALARAAAGEPHEPRWRLLLAQGLLRLGRTEEARRQALRALDLDARQSRAYTLVLQCARQEHAAGPLGLFAELQRSLDERLREEQALRQATWDRPGDPQAYAALAAFMMRAGDLPAAESQLAEALRLRPHSSEIQARLAMLRRLREVL